MMINLLLIFPIVATLLLVILKNKWLNNATLIVYALMHFALYCTYLVNPSLIEKTQYFAIDSTNFIFMMLLSIVFLAVAIYNNGYMRHSEASARSLSHYSGMTLIFVMAITGAILSNNLGLSWVFIEATTLASAYLICFNKTKHSIEAAWKYVFICSIGIALAFVGIILLTIATGSVNTLAFNDLYIHAQSFNHFWLKLSFVFILFGIGTKMGLAPVHFWLPDAHSEAPTPISALLSAALLNSAFLIILKVYRIVLLAGCESFAKIMMLAMGFISLFITAVFIYYITNYKRMLAYSSVENMGILVIGTALGGIAMYAAILHMIAHSLIKASFFLTSGNVLDIYNTKKIKSVSGILKLDKTTGWLWIFSFLGIAAFPPSLLFISEFLMIKTMVVQKQFVLCVFFVVLLTIILFGLAKTIIRMSFGEPNEKKIDMYNDNVKKLSVGMYLPQIVMLLSAFALGCYVPPCVNNLINAVIVGFGG